MGSSLILVSSCHAVGQSKQSDSKLGNAFESHNFLTGKFYPCLGFGANRLGTEMRIRITLRAIEEHPFRFKGPYDGVSSEQKTQPQKESSGEESS
jgi:hypothetical protein